MGRYDKSVQGASLREGEADDPLRQRASAARAIHSGFSGLPRSRCSLAMTGWHY
jgi:hypothetical protein